MTMAVRDHPRVYVPSSLAPGSQFHSSVSSSSPLSAPARAALASTDPKDSCARGARHRSAYTMPAAARTILVTGGAGYIGSHTVLQLLKGGFRVVVVDSLDNSTEIAVERVRTLAGEFGKNLFFHLVDLRDREALEKVFSSTKIALYTGRNTGSFMSKNGHRVDLVQLWFDAVIHFAGLKAVGESVKNPLLYYNNNIIGTINLFEVMATYGCKKLVFSSSATVYGWPKEVPCTEESPLCAMNPYGRTKLMTEDICRDIIQGDSEWDLILLRYFNPVGAHPSGHIGEDPHGTPNNLMPFVQQVAVGRRPSLTVFGNDYVTKDGTGVRDYIHVVDLADGHIAALQKLFEGSHIGCEVYNLGTGKGTSVLEMVAAFEKASGKKIPLVMAGRRPGDAGIVYASTAKAEKELHWRAKYGIEEMCRDQWNWASKNPWGYGSPEAMHEKYPTSESLEAANGKHLTNGSLETAANLKCLTRGSPETAYGNHPIYGSPRAANGKHFAYGSPRGANGKQRANGLAEVAQGKYPTNGFVETANGRHHARIFLEAANVKHTVCGSTEAAANGKRPTYGLSQIANAIHPTSQQHQSLST